MNTAMLYATNNYYTFYVNLDGLEQIKFFWNTATNSQQKPPQWRKLNEPITNMKILDCTDYGFSIKVHKQILHFLWNKTAPKNKSVTKEARLDPVSEKLYSSMTWLEKEVIINQATETRPPTFNKSSPKTWGQRRLEKIKAGDLFK